jgi:hypothetical protein
LFALATVLVRRLSSSRPSPSPCYCVSLSLTSNSNYPPITSGCSTFTTPLSQSHNCPSPTFLAIKVAKTHTFPPNKSFSSLSVTSAISNSSITVPNGIYLQYFFNRPSVTLTCFVVLCQSIVYCFAVRLSLSQFGLYCLIKWRISHQIK